jgi:heavy metal translocating P-type ATPase
LIKKSLRVIAGFDPLFNLGFRQLSFLKNPDLISENQRENVFMTKRRHHKISTFAFSGNPFYFWLDVFIVALSVFVLIANFFPVFIGNFNTIIFLAVALIGLFPVLLSAGRALINRKLTIDLLASIALVFALLNREFHSAVFISLMLASARFFAYFTEKRTKSAIQSLLKLRPTKVLIKTDSQGIIEKPIEEIRLGDLVIVEAGERIAIDGVIIEGSASIDQSSLTGESEPVVKSVGDEVFSSTLNVSGSLLVRTTKIGQDTTFAKILKLIEESQKGKAPISSVIEKFINFYILFTLVSSFLLYFLTHNLLLVLSVLLVTCADDLAIAIPIAFFTAIGTAAKKGIIIKGASFIEGLPKIKLMIFDKTGTLTLGQPKVRHVFVFGNYSEEKFLGILGGLNAESGHPTAKAIYKFVKEKNVKIPEIKQIHEEAGYGIGGTIDGKKVLAGNTKFLENHGIVFSKEEISTIQKEKSRGQMLVALGVEDFLVGFLSLSDTIRPHAKEVVKELKALGIDRMVILTGDNEVVAGEVAKELGISEFQANLLPQDKVNFVKKSLNKKYKVAMLGDGVNDAASLALADVSFAMGAIGSDVSIEAADIALMKDNLKNIVDAIQISKRTMRVVNQNLILWGVINFIGLVLVFAGILGPSAAAAYNFLTDFIPPSNSLRLFKFRKI